MLTGVGQVWVDDLVLEAVDSTVASTGDTKLAAQEKGYLQSLPLKPANADFEAIGKAASADTENRTPPDRTPPDWFTVGQVGKEYAFGVDTAQKRSGKQSAFVKAISDKPEGYRGLGQNIKAGAFRGKRVRFSGYIKAQSVAGWAGLWMNVIGEENAPLGFDNMHDGKTDRAIHGSTRDWQRCFIVLDVPKSAQMLNFGALLSGAGHLWIDDIKLEVVGNKVASTAITIPKEENLEKAVAALPTRPTNLDFEK